jgi:hypothetical protein
MTKKSWLPFGITILATNVLPLMGGVEAVE